MKGCLYFFSEDGLKVGFCKRKEGREFFRNKITLLGGAFSSTDRHLQVSIKFCEKNIIGSIVIEVLCIYFKGLFGRGFKFIILAKITGNDVEVTIAVNIIGY